MKGDVAGDRQRLRLVVPRFLANRALRYVRSPAKNIVKRALGLLCDGIVLGDASVPPARGWIAYDANGDFESETLASRLPRPQRHWSQRACPRPA